MAGDYASYLREVALPQGAATLAATQEETMQMLQAMKNRAAPMVSGGGGGGYTSGGGVSSGGGNSSGGVPQYDTKSGLPVARSSGQTGPLPRMGGKVAPASFSRISQGWGKSRIKYQAGRHTGMDFYGKYGSSIRSAAGGVVVRTGHEGAYGNAIHVRHKDGTTALYAHLSGITVKPGQRVKAGQTVGRMGSTGRSSGTHLHFEIRKQDRYGGDINPRSWYSTR